MRLQESVAGPILVGDRAELLDSPSAPVEALFGSGTNTLAVERRSLPGEFYDLSSGFAGELLQKLSNYRLRLVVFGDFTDLTSKAWLDFQRESNRGGQIVFAESLEAGIRLLRE